jgi:AcrR family transcriptional regulator
MRAGEEAEAVAPAESDQSKPARRRMTSSTGRPRSEEAHQAILDATLALLGEVGYSALTVEGVAQRAGVGKATIYRRWSSKLPLVVEAFGALPGFEDVDAGSLERDLKETLKKYLEAFNTTALGTVFPSLAGERAHNPELSKLIEPVARARREPFVRIFERARARGEISDDVDLGLAADLVLGPISVTLFFRGGLLSPKMVDPIVDLALSGILKRD